MDFLLGKKFKKSKTNAANAEKQSKVKEDDKIRKQLEKEIKKNEKKVKADGLQKIGQSSVPTGKSSINSDPSIETSDNIPDSEGGKYHVSEIIKVNIP